MMQNDYVLLQKKHTHNLIFSPKTSKLISVTVFSVEVPICL